jgi:ATP-binding cassette, subfamily B, bacterial
VAEEPLIGVDDIETPYWARGYEKLVKARLRDVATTVPRIMALVVRWAWRSAPALTLLTGALQLVTGCVGAFGLLATANVFARLLAQGPTPGRVVAALPALAVVVGAYAVRGLLDAGEGAAQASLAPRIVREAEDELYAVLARVDLVAFDEPDFTQLVERVTWFAPGRVQSAVRETSALIGLAVSMASAVVAAGILHPLLAPAVLLAAVPQAWAQVRRAKLTFDSMLRTSSQARRLEVVSELIARRENAAEVRAFTTQEVLLGEHRRIARELLADAIQVGMRQNRATTVGRAISGVGTAVGYVVLGLLLYAGAMPLAVAGTALLAMRTASSAIVQAMFQLSQLYESGITLDLYRSLLADAGARSRPPGRVPLRGDPGEITLTGVSFCYPGQDEPALSDVSLTLRRGDVIALVGENGSGKSTLAKLLTGLYLPETGTVAWDGVDTAAVDADELHERVAVVLQDPLHWPMTAGNNVRIGRLERPDPDGAVFADAAARSGADAVLADLPDGAATMLSRQFQKGRDLSGGQWQRLSVARGLYRDAPLVIADEPTAAMDARAEHAVFAALRGLGGSERITVLVTHRLANVRHADQIVVLEGGRVTGAGTHAELMAAGGTYHELYSLQASAYTDEPSVTGH